jgi:Flp pilus assembly protein TadG
MIGHDKHRTGRRRGQIIVLFAALLVPVLGLILAFATDIGNLVVERGRLQNAADAAALAGAHVLAAQRADGTGESDARALATATAEAVHNENRSAAAPEVQFGVYEDGAFTEADTGTTATAVRVYSRRNESAPGGPLAFFFAPLLGIDDDPVGAASIAAISNKITGVGGLAPFAVHESIAAGASPGDILTVYPAGGSSSLEPNGPALASAPWGALFVAGKSLVPFSLHAGGQGGGGGGGNNGQGGEQTAPGNWGLVDLDEGSNAETDIHDWIEFGYWGVIQLDPDTGCVYFDGNPGFRLGSGLASAIERRQATNPRIIVLLYDEVTAQGANAVYRCTGFILCDIYAVNHQGNDKYFKVEFVRFGTIAQAVAGDFGQESPNLYKIQLVR